MRKINILLVVVMLITALSIPKALASGNTYYISPEGNDSNSGMSFDNAFKSFEKVLSVMTPGDVCIIGDGVYYDSIYGSIRANEYSPVTFKAEENANPIISAGEIISGWELDEGNIYRAKIPFDAKPENSVVFFDGNPAYEARWPNITEDVFDLSSFGTMGELTFDNNVWTMRDLSRPENQKGEVIWFVSQAAFLNITSKITNISGNDLSFGAYATESFLPMEGHPYYITRGKSLLDSENEWYIADGYIYVYSSDGLPEKTVELKKRDFAIDLRNASYVNIEGVSIKGAGVKMNDNTTHCTLSDMTFDTVSYNMESKLNIDAPVGVKIEGTYNCLKNSEIKNNYGAGIEIYGNNNSVLSCFVHNNNIKNAGNGSIDIYGFNQLVRGNTVRRTGRAAISGYFKQCDISYNDLSETMLLSKDGGIIYVGGDCEGTEIHHNYIHGNSAPLGGYQSAIYYDSNTSNIITYNNLIETNTGVSEKPLTLNTPSINNLVFNNTFVSDLPLAFYPLEGSLTGCAFINNSFSNSPFDGENFNGLTESELINDKNVYWERNAVNGDINAGTVISGFDGALAGQIGADNDIKDKVGHNAEVDYSFKLHYALPGVNIIKNGGFEEGFEGWKFEGDIDIINQNAWDWDCLNTMTGNNAAVLGTTGKLKTKLTGLKPNTEYDINIFGQIKGRYYPPSSEQDLNGVTYGANDKVSGVHMNYEKGGYVRYANVDFGNKGDYDTFVLLLNGVDGRGTSTIFQIYIDSIKWSNLVGSYVQDYDDNGNTGISFMDWKERNAEFYRSINGIHDVYIVLAQGNTSLLYTGGFRLENSLYNDVVSASVISDNVENSYDFATIQDKEWAVNPQKLTVKTGDKGEVEIEIKKTTGNNLIYLDNISVKSSFESDGVLPEYIIKNAGVYGTDSEKFIGSILSNFDNIEANIIKFDLISTTGSEYKVNCKVESFEKDGTLYASSTLECVPGKTAALGVSVPGKMGQYIVLTVGSSVYKFRNVDLGNQTGTEGKLRIKKVWINEIENGVKTSANLLIENGDENLKGDIILALYDESGKLTGVMKSECVEFGALETKTVTTNEITPTENAAGGKLFIWLNGEIEPLTSTFIID